MKKTRLFYLLIVFLVIVTVITAVYYKNTKDNTQNIKLIYGSKEGIVTISELDQIEFSGQVINGKGEIAQNFYRGISLYNLLLQKGYDLKNVKAIKITAKDIFSAIVSKEEIMENDHVYLAIERNGERIKGIGRGEYGAQLIVFGDENSRRQVRYVSEIRLYE